MKEICLVDTSWLLNRSLYAFKDFKTSYGRPNGALFGTTNFIKSVVNRGLLTIFCLDTKSDFRKKLNEDYKANRESNNVWTMHEELMNLTRGLPNIRYAYKNGYEADDVLFSLAKDYSEQGYQVYVYSSDNDMLQTLQFPNVYVTRHITQYEMDLIDRNSDYYTKNYPVAPEKLAIYRAFKGDASDNLSSVVPRMQDKLIVEVVDLFYQNIIQKGWDITNPDNITFVLNEYKWIGTKQNWIDKLKDNIDKFITNYKIMKLNHIFVEIIFKSGTIVESIHSALELELYQYSEFLSRGRGVM